MLIDTHVHLTMKNFDNDREKVWERANKNGVKKFVEIGFDLESSKKAVEFAGERQNVYASVGVHPHNAGDMQGSWMEELEKLAKNEKVIGIGEAGLDFYRDLSPREAQRQIFREQIRLARNLELPLVIHCRHAYEDTMRILQEEKAEEVGVVMHCFAGDYEVAIECLRRGYFFGIGGTITFKNSKQRPFINKIPLDSLLLETDCPYLAPMPHRGKRNEPAYVRLVAEELAKAYDTDFKEIEERTTENFQELFGVS